MSIALEYVILYNVGIKQFQVFENAFFFFLLKSYKLNDSQSSFKQSKVAVEENYSCYCYYCYTVRLK